MALCSSLTLAGAMSPQGHLENLAPSVGCLSSVELPFKFDNVVMFNPGVTGPLAALAANRRRD